MGQRTVTDARGEWLETFDDRTGAIISRQMVTESIDYATAREATRAAAEAARTADATRATQVRNILAKLDARTATNNEIQATLAALIRYIGSQDPK